VGVNAEGFETVPLGRRLACRQQALQRGSECRRL
jgi:hypothetical protein